MARRTVCLTLVVIMVLISTMASASSWNFDVSVFNDSTVFEVEYDDMDDTGTVSLVDGGTFIGSIEDKSDGGLLLGDIDIRVIESAPPIIRLTLTYMGEDWIFCDKVIMKPKDTRYTFEVDRKTEVDNGKIYEQYTVVLTDDSIKLLEDILEPDCGLVRYRLDGERTVDGSLFSLNKEMIAKLCECYVASGALNNDFTNLKISFPCEIK